MNLFKVVLHRLLLDIYCSLSVPLVSQFHRDYLSGGVRHTVPTSLAFEDEWQARDFADGMSYYLAKRGLMDRFAFEVWGMQAESTKAPGLIVHWGGSLIGNLADAPDDSFADHIQALDEMISTCNFQACADFGCMGHHWPGT